MKAILMGILFFCMSLNITPVFSQEAVSDKQAVNNKICPVCGDKLGMSKDEEPVTVEYEGKVYNLCGTHCIEDFNKNPKKFVEVIENEMKKSSAESEDSDHAGHDHSKEDHSKENHANHNHGN